VGHYSQEKDKKLCPKGEKGMQKSKVRGYYLSSGKGEECAGLRT